jgi:hypothetical protein
MMTMRKKQKKQKDEIAKGILLLWRAQTTKSARSLLQQHLSLKPVFPSLRVAFSPTPGIIPYYDSSEELNTQLFYF